MQSKAMQSKNKTKQNNAKQCKTQQSNAKQCKRPNPRDTNSKAIIRPGTSLALKVLALASQRTVLMHQPSQLKVVYPTFRHIILESFVGGGPDNPHIALLVGLE